MTKLVKNTPEESISNTYSHNYYNIHIFILAMTTQAISCQTLSDTNYIMC